MSSFRMAERLESLPPYIFSELNRIKAEVAAKGVDLLSLAIGDPDKPTPDAIVKKMQELIGNGKLHGYSPYEGIPSFRNAVAVWMKERFGADVDPNKEVIALIGSKEGIAHFPVAYCNPGDKVLYPDPGYPIFSTAVSLAGGIPVPMALKLENGFLPDLNVVEQQLINEKPKFMILNFPGNPTSTMASRSMLTELVALAKKHNTAIVYDNAYSEIYFDPNNKPLSILEIEGAKDIAIEFHSFSKTYNMTGWRLGFAVGNRDLVAALLKAKTNIDSGPFPAVQETGVYCLQNSNLLSDPIRELYKERREVMLSTLNDLKIEYFAPMATFYVWAMVPNKGKSMDFCKRLIETEGLVTTPGIGFGAEGEHFFRFALTVDAPLIAQAAERLKRFMK